MPRTSLTVQLQEAKDRNEECLATIDDLREHIRSLKEDQVDQIRGVIHDADRDVARVRDDLTQKMNQRDASWARRVDQLLSEGKAEQDGLRAQIDALSAVIVRAIHDGR